MLIGYIKGHVRMARQTVSVIGLSPEQIKDLREDLATYYGWQYITQR